MRILTALALVMVPLAAMGVPLAGRTGLQVPIQSSSGQFIVYGPSAPTLPARLAGAAASTNYLVLEPTFTAISCERIKQALRDKLHMTAPWRGKIYLSLYPAQSANAVVTIVSDKFSNGWEYWVRLPNLVRRERFLRALVQVLLREYANRANPSARPAEIPAWLAQGLMRELPAASEIELLLSPPSQDVRGVNITPENVSSRWTNPLKKVRKDLGKRTPFNFQQLSWPLPGQLTGKADQIYGASAQLFVHQLLQFKDGAACLRAMLRDLPRYRNWQFALLNGFHSHFKRLLDVEKWWALQTVQFSRHDLTDTWTAQESRRKLNGVLHPRVEIRLNKNELPHYAEVNLQTVIVRWDRTQQVALLRHKLAQLDALRLRVVPKLVPLVDDYRRTIYTYLRQRTSHSFFSTAGHDAYPGYDHLAQVTVRELNALDAKRTAPQSSPAPKSSATAVTQASPRKGARKPSSPPVAGE